MNTNEAQTFQSSYKELDPASMALFRTLLNLTVIMFQQCRQPDTEKGATS